MDIGDHARVTGSALKNWLVGQIQDSIIVGLIWLRWTLAHQSSARAVLGIAGGCAAIHSAGWGGTRDGWPGHCRMAQVAGLGTPFVRVDLVRRDRHR